MAVSTSSDSLGIVADSSMSGVAFEVGVTDSNGSPQSVPKRVRRRLMETTENKPKTPASVEEIEAKLKEADLRRQQFHEWLANKARPKTRSPTRPAHHEDLAQRLEAKLCAAEQKRLELMAQAQMRLAKLHELRQAAKTEVQLRAEREREELESKVESRVQQAETNRMALLEAERQRRAAAQERMAHSLLQRMLQEDKERERMETLHASICQKVAAAEEKRLGLIEAEKTRAHATVMQARRVAKSVCCQREMEMRKMKERLEDRLQRAKSQRAEYLRQRGICRGASYINRQKMSKHGDRLSRKLARCWRQFQRSRRTTYVLAHEYTACAINQSTATSLPFEQLASRIQSASTLQSVKALLARIESRFMLSQASRSNCAKIDHLLKRLSPGNKRNSNRAAKKVTGQVPIKGASREGQNHEEKELPRYPTRVFLCAYMILGHPDAVFSGRGDREIALAEAAANLVPKFEALITTILNGPACSPQSRPSSPNTATSDDLAPEVARSLCPQRPFAAQLAAFDTAWCSYLYQFVVWKVRDAQSLEEDLIRVACQLEVSMLQKCKINKEGSEADLSHDSKAIRRQVLEDQQLLRERVMHLSGSSGTARMEVALSDARSKFMEAKENGIPLLSPFSHASFSPSSGSLDDQEEGFTGKPRKVARSLFNDNDDSQSRSNTLPSSSSRLGDALEAKLLNDNEVMVNDILHDANGTFADTLCGMNKVSSGIKADIKSTMENAFWDGVVESLTRDPPDYNWVVGLVKEVRDELDALIPQSWKQELFESIDPELFSQILESGSQDIEYLSKLLDYALGIVLKLAIPANDNDAKAAHGKLFHELSEIVAGMDKKSNHSFAFALVKGLRFILEQIQVLKKEISAARIRALEPLVQGSAGVNYLQEAFSMRYGASCGDANTLPVTVQWLTSVKQIMEQERSDFEAALAVLSSSQPNATMQAPGLPPVTSLRTGGLLGLGKDLRTAFIDGSTLSCSPGGACKDIQWNTPETLVRVGLLQLASRSDALNEDTTPETLKLNVGRLCKTQNDFQRIVVIATSMLLVRQTLAGKGVQGAELDNVLHDANKQLGELLNDHAVNIHHIGRLLSQLCLQSGDVQDEVNSQELMTRILSRSLLAEDVVFVRVSAAVRSGMRAILLAGKGFEGRFLSELSLKRVGAGTLIDLVVEAADALDIMAAITCHVHGPWYTQIVNKM